MRIPPFALERYFAEHEFSTKYLLSSSDCDGLAMSELLSWADPEAKGLWEKLTLGYTESQGLPILRREIASLYMGVSPEQVFVAAPQECILIAMQCLLEKGDRVVCTFPGYQSLYQLAESMGCEVDRWEPSGEGEWRFRLEDLEKKLTPKTKLLIVNFPHNPTGALPSADEFRKLVELARSRGVRVFSDEMYRMLELDPKDRLPSACELDDSAIVLFGMSKTFGLAGLRVGWLIVKDAETRERFAEYKDYTTICPATPSELLSLIGLRSRERILERHRARAKRNLGLLDAFFAKRSGELAWSRPKAGTIGFARLLKGDAEAYCAKARSAGVLLLPSTVYGWPKPAVRFGFGRENLPEALKALETVL